MLRLCGFPISNYYNKVKLALLEKGVSFQEKRCMTGAAAAAAGSPMGKVPFLETPEGVLCESQAIVEYLEEVSPEPALYPREAFARARCRELIHFLELYLELPARRLYPEVYFGGTVSEQVKASAREQLERGVRAVGERIRFAPYAAGASFTYADCSAYAVLPLVSQSTKKIYGEDFVVRLPGAGAYLELLRTRPHVQRINAERKADVERSLAERRQSAWLSRNS